VNEVELAIKGEWLKDFIKLWREMFPSVGATELPRKLQDLIKKHGCKVEDVVD
jgi:hypothetical protein